MVVRFTKDGCAYDLDTHKTLPRGSNVIYHPVYWGVTLEWAEEMAKKYELNIVKC